jgi:hypothetical protein
LRKGGQALNRTLKIYGRYIYSLSPLAEILEEISIMVIEPGSI